MRCTISLGCLLACLIAFAQEDIPFKPNSEFEAKIELVFLKRESADVNTFRFPDATEKKKTMDSKIPFLAINFKVLKADGEVRMKVLNGRNERSHKIKINSVLKLELGFIEDIKSQGETTFVTIFFLNDQKMALSKVIFSINEDGAFLVNGEKRGKF